jgi:radical SAM protein with 4Fe4S-binding SPASM domain
VFNYLRILEDFNISKKHDTPIFDGRTIKECGMEKKQYRYCGSGVDRILVDFRGDVYPCDGLCYAKTVKIGNISEGIEFEKLEFFQKLKDDPKPFYESCKGCEIETECPRAKCMGINLLLTGNMFTPEKNWCEIAKTFHEIGWKYEKLKSQKEKVEAYV